MKICSKCNVVKELIDFSKRKTTKDGLSNQCKLCNKHYYLNNKLRIAQYYLHNRVEILEQQTQYQLNHKDEKVAYQAQYYLNNKIEIAEYKAQHYLDNKIEIAEYKAQYYLDNEDKMAQYRLDNKDRIAEYQARYRHNNPDKYYSNGIRYFCSMACKYSILERDNFCCQCCGADKKLQLHHILPIKDDTNTKHCLNPKNLVILCSLCHIKAHDGAYKRVNVKIAKQLLLLIRAKETIKKTLLPIYQPKGE